MDIQAPDFELQDQNGKTHRLQDYNKQRKVLYFYPKDDTPGCTIEAKKFSDLEEQFKELNTKVFGISKDSIDSHQKFTDKCSLKVTLLSDNTGETCKKYGLSEHGNLLNKITNLPPRVTFLIDENNIITHIWEKVEPTEHALQVLEYIRTLK